MIAERIGDGGGKMLKSLLAESLNEKLRPLRTERKKLEKDEAYIKSVLSDGIRAARAVAEKTLDEVRTVMNMAI